MTYSNSRAAGFWSALAVIAVLARVGGAQTASQTAPTRAPAPVPVLVDQSEQSTEQSEPTVLTRGPLHEAYAVPVELDPSPSELVLRQPPEAIEELPPEERPGEDAIWISGYWSWDAERDDFLWVSGVWRVPPQDHDWVPGYWIAADNGYRWVSGYWQPVQSTQTQYLPEPPATLDLGPTSSQPVPDAYWVPGYWYWHSAQYVWRPGYWARCQPNWIWCPSYYLWTPAGYLFVDGYWDYPFDRRGVVYAPVYCSAWRHHHHYRFRPSIVISTGFLSVHLFVNSHRHHYCFGDYYGDHHRRHGIHGWHTYHRHGRHHDPIFAHHRALAGSGGRDWETSIRQRYDRLAHNKTQRPAPTLKRYRELTGGGKHGKSDRSVPFGTLRQVAGQGKNPTPVRTLDKQSLQKVVERTRKASELQKHRLASERRGKGHPGTSVRGFAGPSSGHKPHRTPTSSHEHRRQDLPSGSQSASPSTRSKRMLFSLPQTSSNNRRPTGSKTGPSPSSSGNRPQGSHSGASGKSTGRSLLTFPPASNGRHTPREKHTAPFTSPNPQGSTPSFRGSSSGAKPQSRQRTSTSPSFRGSFSGTKPQASQRTSTSPFFRGSSSGTKPQTSQRTSTSTHRSQSSASPFSRSPSRSSSFSGAPKSSSSETSKGSMQLHSSRFGRKR